MTVSVLKNGAIVEMSSEQYAASFYPPTFEESKAAMVEAIGNHIETLLVIGAPIGGGLRVVLDDGSRADMTAMATTAIAAASGAVPWPESYQQGWITASNVRVPLPSPADGLGLAAGVGDHYAQIRQHGRTLKDAVLAAGDANDLDAIDINAGWPE